MDVWSIVDSHVHSDFSDDCKIPAYAQIAKGCELGLKGIALTDHYDIDYPNPRYRFEFNIEQRRHVIQELKNRYEGRMHVFHGIEIGIQRTVIEQSATIIKQDDFDCVISSVHAVDGFSLCSQSGFFEHKTKAQAYMRYLEEIYYSLCHFSDYDIVGHIGYIRRYGPYDHGSMPYREYAEILDMILQKIIKDGKAIEINTSGFFYKLGTTIPEIDLFKRFYELGGTMVTIGSDAHTVERVADHFDVAVAILKQVGFTYITHFEHRKPIFDLL